MTEESAALTRIRCRATAVGYALARQPAWLIVLMFMAASLIRSGIVLWNWFYLSPQLIDTWDAPQNAFQSNVLFNAMGTLWALVIGPPEGALWLSAQLILSIASLFLIGWLVLQRTWPDIGPLGLALIFASGVSAVIWREVGRYDFIFICAIFFALITRNRWMRLGALAIAAISAPEQALLAALTWTLIALLPQFREWLRSGLDFLGLAVLTSIGVQIWFQVAGTGLATRFGLMAQLVQGDLKSAPSRFDPGQGFVNVIIQKFYEGLAPGPALIWSYLGAMTFVLLLLVIAQPSLKSALWLLGSVIAFPLATTLFFGEDPTRDLVIVGVPALVILLLKAGPMIRQLVEALPGIPIVWLTWSAVVVTLLPTVYFFFTSEIAYNFINHLLISWNNGTPVDWSGNTR